MRNELITFRNSVLAAMLSLVAASCSDDAGTDNRLPEGKYPITFSAAVDGLTVTRATAEGSWDGTEEVAIQIGNDVKIYKAYNEGMLASTEPFYWQKADETKEVSAWYLGTGYSSALPTEWSVQSEQDKTENGNSSDNYQRSDFLYAPQADISYSDSEKKLVFYHQTAKVILNIRNAEPLTDVNQITAVSINNVALNGKFSEPSTGNYGLEVNSLASQTSTITSRKLTTPNTGVIFENGGSPETALASYEALVIPQTVIAGDNFIGITLGGATYYYKAEAGKNTLNAGNVHTYNITVIGQELSVTTSTSSSEWTKDGDDVTVTGREK